MAKIVRPFILLPPQFGKIAQRDLRHVRDQKRQLEGAGCFISGDSGKKAQGCSWHPHSFSESAAPESPVDTRTPWGWEIHCSSLWLCWVHGRGWNGVIPPTLPLWCYSFSAAPCPLIIPFSCTFYMFIAVEHL